MSVCADMVPTVVPIADPAAASCPPNGGARADPTTDLVVRWLRTRLQQDGSGRVAPPVRLVGVLVVDPTFADPDTAARAVWIGDGCCVSHAISEHVDDLDRFDVVVGVARCNGVSVLTVARVNP
jgi:hypothetical protein